MKVVNGYLNVSLCPLYYNFEQINLAFMYRIWTEELEIFDKRRAGF